MCDVQGKHRCVCVGEVPHHVFSWAVGDGGQQIGPGGDLDSVFAALLSTAICLTQDSEEF